MGPPPFLCSVADVVCAPKHPRTLDPQFSSLTMSFSRALTFLGCRSVGIAPHVLPSSASHTVQGSMHTPPPLSSMIIGMGGLARPLPASHACRSLGAMATPAHPLHTRRARCIPRAVKKQAPASASAPPRGAAPPAAPAARNAGETGRRTPVPAGAAASPACRP